MKESASLWVGGIHAVESLLKHSPERILQLVHVDKGQTKLDHLIQLAKEQRLARHVIHIDKLNHYLPHVQHQGVAVQCRPLPGYTEHDIEDLIANAKQQRWLILDGVQDPHNLGACLRSADGAGVTAVIIPRDRAVGLTPVVRKVASGAAEMVPVVVVTNLARAMEKLQDAGIYLVGLAGETPHNFYELDLRRPTALVLGSEDKGLRRLTRENCDVVAALPMHGSVNSLNVSVATGICLYELVRQNR
jgi:23S rRNA (guanosine2251-2'-O)-methyltransferase